MADNPFLLPDGSVNIFAVTNHSKRSDTSIEGEVIGKNDYFVLSDKMRTKYPEMKEPIEGDIVERGSDKKLLEEFGKVAERDLIQRLTPIEGEVVPPSAKEQGLRFMLDAMKKVHRDNPRRSVLEGEVITPADDAKERSDNAAMIVDIGLAVLATGDYVALPPTWQGSDAEKEVKDITPLQIEKKD